MNPLVFSNKLLACKLYIVAATLCFSVNILLICFPAQAQVYVGITSGTSDSNGFILRAALDSGVPPAAGSVAAIIQDATALVPSPRATSHLFLDLDESFLYWSDRSAASFAGGTGGTINRSSLDGSNATCLVGNSAECQSNVSINLEGGLVVDNVTGRRKLYFIGSLNSGNLAVLQADLDSGANVVAVFDTGSSIPSLLDMDIDTASGFLYVSAPRDSNAPANISSRILRFDISSTDPTAITGSVRTVCCGTGSDFSPTGIALDVPNNHIYWSDPLGVATSPGIYRSWLDQLDATSPEITAFGSSQASPGFRSQLAIDPNGGLLYWNDTGLSGLVRAPLPTTIQSSEQPLLVVSTTNSPNFAVANAAGVDVVPSSTNSGNFEVNRNTPPPAPDNTVNTDSSVTVTTVTFVKPSKKSKSIEKSTSLIETAKKKKRGRVKARARIEVRLTQDSGKQKTVKKLITRKNTVTVKKLPPGTYTTRVRGELTKKVASKPKPKVASKTPFSADSSPFSIR